MSDDATDGIADAERAKGRTAQPPAPSALEKLAATLPAVFGDDLADEDFWLRLEAHTVTIMAARPEKVPAGEDINDFVVDRALTCMAMVRALRKLATQEDEAG